MTAHTLTLSIQCAGVLPADLERDLFLSLPPGSPLRAYADEMADALAAARRDAEKAEADAQADRDEARRLQSVVDGLFRALETLDDHAHSAPEAQPGESSDIPAHWSSVLRMTNTLSGWGEDDAEAWNDPRARARLIGARLWSELRSGRWEMHA